MLFRSKKLLEVVITDRTADWVTNKIIQLGRKLDKHVIVVRDGPGFYTTRTLAFFLAESLNILSEGISIEAIDHALEQFGFSQGPFSLMDKMGLSATSHILKTLNAAFPESLVLSNILGKIIRSGRYGCVNFKGFYNYIEGEKSSAEQEVYSSAEIENNSSSLASDEITERCLMIFVNESVKCLEENILAKASDGDIGAVYGLEFPAFWGGPFKYIDFVGAHHIVEIMERLAEKYGDRFLPAQLLKKYASENLKFFPNEPWKYVRH